MVRYTFEEIKVFQLGMVFWARGQEYEVNSAPTYISESDFYGDFSEKVEWTAIERANAHQITFQVTNVRDRGNASDPIIFKTATSEPVIGYVNRLL